MSKKVISFVSSLLLFICLPLIPVQAAVKAGASCKSAGITSVVSGKTFTCVKSGKKLIWAAAVIDPKPSLKVNSEGLEITCGDGFNNCPEVTSNVSSASECKIEDLTPLEGVSSGFTRPRWIGMPFNEADVLILPFSFSDLPADQVFLDSLKNETAVFDKWMKTNSYGKFKINWSFAEKSNWINLPGTYSSYKSQLDSNARSFVQGMLQNYNGINLKKYKGLLIVGNRSNTISGGQEFTSSIFSTPSGTIQGVSFTYGLNSTNLEHNIGHTIFALEDLYLHPFFKTSTSDNWPVKWDIMGGGSDFVAWHRWINRWIDDNQVGCIGEGKKSEVFYLTNINKVDGKVKLISAITNNVATMAEYRYEPNRKRGGVIVYALDTRIGHGAGPMTGDETMIQAKSKIIKNGITFEVIDVDSGGVYVKVSRN